MSPEARLPRVTVGVAVALVVPSYVLVLAAAVTVIGMGVYRRTTVFPTVTMV